MADTSRRKLLGIGLGALGLGAAVTAFCAAKIYETSQQPAGDGSGMQWVILTPLTLLFALVALPAFITGARALTRWRSIHDPALRDVVPWRGWQIALGLLLLYLLAPFIVAPILGLFSAE
jgi:hypothetical protein